jgi:hypothetical protein
MDGEHGFDTNVITHADSSRDREREREREKERERVTSEGSK